VPEIPPGPVQTQCKKASFNLGVWVGFFSLQASRKKRNEGALRVFIASHNRDRKPN